MPIDMFLKRKKDILSKEDKSSKGNVDEKIKNLCEKINSLEDCYTTSSCSGRIVIMVNQEKKAEGLLIKVYHDLISFEQIKKDLEELTKRKEDFKFKMEPCALHVAFRNFEDAQKFYEKAKLLGWKKAGLIGLERRFVVEINGSERLEFPIIKKGKILVNDEFLKIVIEEANEKLKKGWKKIGKLGENVEQQNI
jgi:tRNA wybutosine-synthesizing protein 3